MRELTTLISFVLLIIGTIGLVVNEFIFDWGRIATLLFAVFNIVGLILLACRNWGMKNG